jgi:hypothetical protein
MLAHLSTGMRTGGGHDKPKGLGIGRRSTGRSAHIYRPPMIETESLRHYALVNTARSTLQIFPDAGSRFSRLGGQPDLHCTSRTIGSEQRISISD